MNALRTLLERNPQITGIDQLVPALPESYRKYYTLVFNSQSLQGASYAFPRVISFGATASGYYEDLELGDYSKYKKDGDQLILAFKGDPHLANKDGIREDRLEVIEFDAANHRYKFFEVQFADSDDWPRNLPKAQRYRIEGPNPPKCLACHRQEPRPNWMAYPSWPGVYGSRDHAQLTEETQKFNNLFLPNRSSGRYRALGAPPTRNGNLLATRNKELTNRLEYFQYLQAARVISESPDHARYKYAIYAAFQGCDRIDTFLPYEVTRAFKHDYDSLYRATLDQLSQEAIEKTFKEGKHEAATIAPLRYLFENRGLDAQAWMMRFEPGNYEFAGHGMRFRDGVGGAYRWMVDAEVRRDPSCETLRAKSLRAFN